MRKSHLAMLAVCVVLLAGGAWALSRHDAAPDPAACRAAMRHEFITATLTGQEQSRPRKCVGVDEKTLVRFASEIVMGQPSSSS